MHSWSSPAKTILRYTPSSSRGQLPISICGRRACVSPKTAANAPSGAATRMVAARRGFPSGICAAAAADRGRGQRAAFARTRRMRTGGRKNAFPAPLCGIKSGGAGLGHSAFGPDNRRGNVEGAPRHSPRTPRSRAARTPRQGRAFQSACILLNHSPDWASRFFPADATGFRTMLRRAAPGV